MDNKTILEIGKKISTFLKQEYPNIHLDIKQLRSEFGFKMELTGVEKDKLKDLENKNTKLSLSYGFTQNIVGMEFEGIRGSKRLNHKIVGFKPANHKYPIITVDTNSGSSYKLGPDHVKKQLGGDKLINRKSNLDKLLK